MWLLTVAPLGAGCLPPECVNGSVYTAECRVAAENHHARLVTSQGVDLRFHTVGTTERDGWDALGVFEESPDGTVLARPAGLGDFVLSLEHPSEAVTISLRLENVASDLALRNDAEEPVPNTRPTGLSRELTLDLAPGEPTRIQGRRPCPDVYRLVAAGDIQTNPRQFERIIQDLHNQAADAASLGEPLLGMLLLGDLTEDATEAEFRRIREILASSPVPVATTPGNHDIIGGDLGTYNRLFGPGSYAFDVCRTRVAMLDTANGALAPSIEGRLPELVDRGPQPFLIAGTHYPAVAGRTGAGFADELQAAYLLSELVRNGAEALFVGHVHTWLAFEDVPVGPGAIDQYITGTAGASQGAGLPFFGVTRMRFGNSMQTCFVEVPEPGRLPGDDGPGSGALQRCSDP